MKQAVYYSIWISTLDMLVYTIAYLAFYLFAVKYEFVLALTVALSQSGGRIQSLQLPIQFMFIVLGIMLCAPRWSYLVVIAASFLGICLLAAIVRGNPKYVWRFYRFSAELKIPGGGLVILFSVSVAWIALQLTGWPKMKA